MSHSPKISVITPTKNRLKLLRETIDSVQGQSFEAWEHIIVDDGSDDGTEEEVARRAATDSRILYIKRIGEKFGANVCRNIGVVNSQSELIVFLDSDDILEYDCLANRVEVMQRNPALDFATFQRAVFEKTPGDLGEKVGTQLLGDDLLRFLFFECPWIITGPVWRRESLLQLGLFDESLPSWQDIDLHVRAITAGLKYLRFGTLDHHVRWQFEPTKTSVEQRRSVDHLEAAIGTVEKFEQLVRQGPGMTWSRQRALCKLYFFVAELWVGAGHPSSALRAWRQIRRRQLGSWVFFISGAALLVVQSLGKPGARIGKRVGHKWQGWMRMRTDPELIDP